MSIGEVFKNSVQKEIINYTAPEVLKLKKFSYKSDVW